MRDKEPWDDCPAGVVTEMATGLRRRRLHARLRPAVASGVVVLLVCLTGYGLMSRDESATHGVLTCRETVSLLAKYHDQSLQASQAHDVQEHLAGCPMCRKHYERMYPSEVRNDSTPELEFVTLAANFGH